MSSSRSTGLMGIRVFIIWKVLSCLLVFCGLCAGTSLISLIIGKCVPMTFWAALITYCRAFLSWKYEKNKTKLIFEFVSFIKSNPKLDCLSCSFSFLFSSCVACCFLVVVQQAKLVNRPHVQRTKENITIHWRVWLAHSFRGRGRGSALISLLQPGIGALASSLLLSFISRTKK